jgi:hypothetical protein
MVKMDELHVVIFKMTLDFFQAISWPTVTFAIFYYFAPVLHKILLSVNQAVSQRGIKLSKTGVEIPGPQEEIESIHDLIHAQRDWGELLKQPKAENVDDPLMAQTEPPGKVLEHHERNLVEDIQSSLRIFLDEKTTELYSRQDLLQDLLCDAYICLYFERCFQRLLNSQLLLLQALNDSQEGVLSKEDVMNLFDKCYPDLPLISYQKWLNYLEGLRFLHFKPPFIKLTKEGREFLRYIQARGYTIVQAN